MKRDLTRKNKIKRKIFVIQMAFVIGCFIILGFGLFLWGLPFPPFWE
jgi:hypothetical protein